MRNLLVVCLVSLAAAFPSSIPGNRRAVGLVAESLNNVTESILHAARKVHGCNENLLYSPLSISVAIAMLLEGSAGNTKEQIVNALHLPRGISQASVREGFRELLQSLSAQGNDISYILDIASGLFVQKDIRLKPEFRSTLTNKYSAVIQNKDFQGNTQAVEQELNAWVAEKTRNEIPQFLSPGSLSARTVLYLLNAVYFSGQWETQFPVQDTNLMPFSRTETDKIDVEMMHAQADYRAARLDELQADAVEIPYEGQRMSMLVIVPHRINGLRDVERSMSSKMIEDILYRKIVHRPVQLSMPKLNIEADLKLKEVMMELGIHDVFQTYANLSKISPDYEQGLYVDSAQHKAVLRVDEHGTKAAAVTGIGIVPLSADFRPPKPMTIQIDRPFLLYIWSYEDRVTLFTGAIMNPQ